MSTVSPALCTVIRRKGKIVDCKSISFNEFSKAIDRAARNLQEMGIESGSRVLLLVAPGQELILMTFALLKIGAIPVVIDPGMGIKSFLNCVKNSSPKFLLGNTKAIWLSYIFYPIFRSIRKINVKNALNFTELTRDHQNGRHERYFPSETRRELQRKPERTNVREDFPQDYLRVYEGNNLMAAILFTSGSTGAPKGVCYTHRHFCAQLNAIKEAFNILPGEVDLPLLPVFALFNPALGMSTVVPEMDARKPSELNPAYAIESIRKFQVTNSFGSPRLWTKIAEYCEQTNQILPSLKRILIAGAPASPQLLKRVQALLTNGEVYTPYGATEALPLTLISAREVLEETLNLTLQGHGTCVGKPLPSVEIRVLTPDTSNIDASLPSFSIGEIVVSGPMVTETYDNNLKANAEHKIWVGDRCWHRMGDMGYFDDKGRLWFCGRKAEQVIIESNVWYTECCEPIFNTHPNVFRSALIHLKTKNGHFPAIVVEPIKFPYSTSTLKSELQTLALKYSTTQQIQHFFLHKKFPVDVRHNAKIHRLTLAQHFSR